MQAAERDTGDALVCDENGNLSFPDRIKDAIRRRGEIISLFEVEAAVIRHPEVLECAAVAASGDFAGDQEVKVVVVRRPGSQLEAAALIEFLIPAMPRYMVSRYVEFASSSPRTTASGKVRKAELRSDTVNDRTWDREAAGIVIPRIGEARRTSQ